MAYMGEGTPDMICVKLDKSQKLMDEKIFFPTYKFLQTAESGYSDTLLDGTIISLRKIFDFIEIWSTVHGLHGGYTLYDMCKIVGHVGQTSS